FLDGEVEECEEFELIGEDPVVLQNPDEAGNDKNTLPCRLLEDFIIFDANKQNQVVSLDEIEVEGRELHAAGIVKPMFIEYSQNGQSEIWLRTQYGFYKLRKAAQEYIQYFTPVFKRIRTANLAIEAIARDPE
ncbi:1824_t:CDS:2, partial [Racocetra persica]